MQRPEAMETRKTCGLCGSDELAVFYSLKNFNLGFNVMKCRNCGLLFRDIILADREIRELYGRKYFQEEQAEYFFDNSAVKTAVLSAKLGVIEHFRPAKGRLLDVGCAIGTFLFLAKKAGWETRGVEVSEYASEYARSHYHLDVATGTLDEADLAAGSFDVITLWDTIEHVEFPQEVLKSAWALLKPDGLLVLQTTMDDGLLSLIAARIYRWSFRTVKWPLSRCHPVHHATFYTSATLAAALTKAGFSVVSAEPYKMRTELVHTHVVVKWLLAVISALANAFDKPYERIFVARKASA